MHAYLSSALITNEFSDTLSEGPSWCHTYDLFSKCLELTSNCFSFLYLAFDLAVTYPLWAWQWLEGKWHDAKLPCTLALCPRCRRVFWKCWLLSIYFVNGAVNIPFSVYSSHVMDSIKATKPGWFFPTLLFQCHEWRVFSFVEDHNKLIIGYFYTGYFTWELKRWHLHFPQNTFPFPSNILTRFREARWSAHVYREHTCYEIQCHFPPSCFVQFCSKVSTCIACTVMGTSSNDHVWALSKHSSKVCLGSSLLQINLWFRQWVLWIFFEQHLEEW